MVARITRGRRAASRAACPAPSRSAPRVMPLDRAARVDHGAGGDRGGRQPAGIAERVDAAARCGSPSRPANGRCRPGRAPPRPIEHPHRRAAAAPLPDAASASFMREGRCAGWIQPFCTASAWMPCLRIRSKTSAGAVADQRDEVPRPSRAPPSSCGDGGDDGVRVHAREVRDDLAVVAAGGAVADLGGFQHGAGDAGLGQVQRGGQAGEAGADHRHVGCAPAGQRHGRRRRRRGRRPEAFRHGRHGLAHPRIPGAAPPQW